MPAQQGLEDVQVQPQPVDREGRRGAGRREGDGPRLHHRIPAEEATLQGAEAHLQAYLKLNPNHLETSALLAYMQEEAGDAEGAASAWADSLSASGFFLSRKARY